MSSYNRVLLVGRLGHTPILKSTQSGKPFCRLNLATQNGFNKDGEIRETSWHNIHVFGKEAENASRYLTKGRQVLIEGKIDTKSSMKDGAKTFQTFITADRVTFLGSSQKNSREDVEESGEGHMEESEAQSEMKDMLFGTFGNLSH